MVVKSSSNGVELDNEGDADQHSQGWHIACRALNLSSSDSQSNARTKCLHELLRRTSV